MKPPKKTISHPTIILLSILVFLGVDPAFGTVGSSGQQEKIFQASVDELYAGNYGKAERGFRSILEQEPNNLDAHYYLGLIKYEQQMFPEALAFFQWVETKAPQMPVVHYYLGLIAYDRQDWQKALKEMEEAESLDPKISMVEYYLVLIHYKMREVQQAESSFRLAVKLEPSLTMAHYALAYLLFHDRKDPRGALSEIKAGLKGNLDSKLHKKFVLLCEEIQGPEMQTEGGVQDSPAGRPSTKPSGTPSFIIMDRRGFVMGGHIPGPPDAPDFRDRPLFGPGFEGGLPPPMPLGFPPDSGLWKKNLGLSKAQSTQVDALLKKQMADLKSLQGKMWKDRETLRSKIKTRTSDAEIEKLLDVLSQDRKNFTIAMDEFDKQIRSILTPRQRAKIMLGLDQKVWMKPGKGLERKEIKVFDNFEGVEVEPQTIIPAQHPSQLKPDSDTPVKTPLVGSIPGSIP